MPARRRRGRDDRQPVDLTPRRREWHQRRLVEARGRELDEHYARLDELMAVTAHDLRSPLLGLRNLIRLTLDRARDDPSQVLASLRHADRSLRSVLALISGLLDAHEAERGAVGEAVRWDLRSMLDDLIARAKPSAEASGADADLHADGFPAAVLAMGEAIRKTGSMTAGDAETTPPSSSRLTRRT